VRTITWGVLVRKQDYDGAMAEYREAIRLKPDDLDAHVWIGYSMAMKKDWDDAIAQYLEVLRRKPDSTDALLGLSNDLDGKKDPQARIDTYRGLVRSNPNVADFHEDLALSLASVQQYDQALEEYREAVRVDPSNPRWHVNIANALKWDKHDLSGAITEYREAVRSSRMTMKPTTISQAAWRKSTTWTGQLPNIENHSGATRNSGQASMAWATPYWPKVTRPAPGRRITSRWK